MAEPEVKRWASAADVQKLMSGLPGMSDKWENKKYWREFTKKRREFFIDEKASEKPDEDERNRLRTAFEKWVSESDRWWGGSWGGNWGKDHSLSDWHVNQHVRTRRHKDPGQNPPLPPEDRSSQPASETVFYDAVRDAQDAL